MKKFSILLLVVLIISLVGCKPDDNVFDDNSSQSLYNSQVASDSESSIFENSETIKQKETATKYFPSDFKEAIDIEEKRQEVLFTGSRADMGNANDQAFAEMKLLYNSYCKKIISKLNDNQKKAFATFIESGKQYNNNLDMLTFKTLSQQVYTNGNAACSEAYNLMMSNTILMYYYFNQLSNQMSKNNDISHHLDEQLNTYMFFNNDISGLKNKSIPELININKQYTPLLRNILNSTSQPVFDEYKKSYENYLSAITSFEQLIDITPNNSKVYSFTITLNSAIISNLYDVLKDIKYPDGMFETLNVAINKDEYLEKWN